jgi:hypothetical protein
MLSKKKREQEARLQLAKQQITQAREQLEAKRREAELVQKQLEQARQTALQKLPERKSQVALRKKFVGVSGLESRKKIAGVETGIESEVSQRKETIEQFKSQLTKFEQEQISPVESQIAEYEKKKQAFERAKELYYKGIPATYVSGLARKYLKKFYLMGSTKQKITEEVSIAPIEEVPKDMGSIIFKPSESDIAKKFEEKGYNVKIVDKIEIPQIDIKKELAEIKIKEPTINLDISKLNIPTPSPEIYNPQTGMYMRQSPTGYGSTAYMRLPTTEEKARMDEMGKVGKFIFGVSKKSENIITADINELSTRDPASTIGVGFGGAIVQKPISSFDIFLKGDRSKSVYSTIGIVRETLGVGFYEGIESVSSYLETKSRTGGNRILKPEDIKTIKESTFEVPYQGTIGTDPFSGKQITTKTITIPEQKVIKQDVWGIGSEIAHGTAIVGGIVGRTVPYLNPAGGYIYLGTEAERLGYNIQEQGSTLGGFSSWVEEAPLESTIALTIPLAKVLQTTGTFLKKQITTRVPIKNPMANLEAESVIHKDINIITKEGQINKVIYPNQQILQMSSEGSRVIQTSKWNEFFGKKVRISKGGFEILPAEPLYAGVPYGKVGSETYKEAFNRLIKSGVTESQARQTLRYIPPRTITQSIEGKITVKGGNALGRFTFETKKPVITIDEKLGIKTKGGKPTKDITTFQRKVITGEDKSIVIGVNTKLKELNKIPKQFEKGYDFSTNVEFLTGEESAIKKGYEPLGGGVFKEGEYKILTGTSFERQIVPTTPIKYTLNLDNKVISFKKTIDLTGTGASVQPSKIVKTPFSKTFGEQIQITEEALKLPPIINKPSIKTPTIKQTNINAEVSIGVSYPSMVGGIRTESLYAGTGQYERTENLGLTPSKVVSSDLLGVGTGLGVSNIQKSGELELYKLSSGLKSSLGTPQTESIKDIQLESQTNQLKSASLLKSLQEQKQIQKQQLKPVQKQILKQQPKLEPKLIPFGISLGDIKKAKKVIGNEEKFGVFVKKFGKDVSVGEFGTLEGAKKKLTEELIGTIRAGGYITKGKEKIKAKELKLFGTEFRPSKQSEFSLIQRRSKRLKKGGQETKEIIGFRKSKKKKSLFGL